MISENIQDIDRHALVQAIKSRFPAASVKLDDDNRAYSWVIHVIQNGQLVYISWGGFTGFGATDTSHLVEGPNMFGAYDWSLESADAAIDFIAKAFAE